MGYKEHGENYYENSDRYISGGYNMTRLGPVYGGRKSPGVQAAGNLLFSGAAGGRRAMPEIAPSPATPEFMIGTADMGEPNVEYGPVRETPADIMAAIDEALAAVNAAYTQQEQGES